MTAERAVEMAQRLQDERILAEAEHYQGMALANMGRLADGLSVLDKVVARAEAVGDLTTLCDVLDTMGYVTALRGEFDRSTRYLDRALAVAE